MRIRGVFFRVDFGPIFDDSIEESQFSTETFFVIFGGFSVIFDDSIEEMGV